MEASKCTVLNSKPGVLHGKKRKRAVQRTIYFPGALHATTPPFPSLSLASQKHGKRRRLEECRGRVVRHDYPSKRSLLLCYSNFKKTGIPKRIMFFEKGEWIDFPHDLIASIRKDLNTKNPAIEVEIDGQSFVLDFLHMFRLEQKTGSIHPIAWIDEAGGCFFPETFTGEDEAYRCCEHEYENDQESMFSESYAPHEIKLQVDIDINGVEQSKLKECSGESSSFVRHFQIAQKPASSHCAVEVEDNGYKNADGKPNRAVEDIKKVIQSVVGAMARSGFSVDLFIVIHHSLPSTMVPVHNQLFLVLTVILSSQVIQSVVGPMAPSDFTVDLFIVIHPSLPSTVVLSTHQRS